MASEHDRTVHARSASGEIELVRYDRAGRWYVEDKGAKERVRTVGDAVGIALLFERNGGEILLQQPGGQQFDNKVAGARAKNARHR